ncbi:hypothetical protein J2Z83_001287 [Virgibacillus natechei]|uniref:Uncharacterized protein n=1 Tax=Virgibacillus natechei TaxID=1216297 RepID=A0ABS4IE15_9BACI|nr:hypothetical protein [Virgibacillus natechei]
MPMDHIKFGQEFFRQIFGFIHESDVRIEGSILLREVLNNGI